jgi:hypothetical protein
MITYIKRKDLDIIKYNTCIENSKQSRVYAFSWYLDIVADNWDVLVLEDYKAVMPIPWNSKYGLKYCSQPFFCQQISIYSKEDVDEEHFLKKIPKSFLIIFLNLSIKPEKDTVIDKINYELKLNSDYTKLFENYRKDRRKSFYKAEKASLSYKDNGTITSLVQLYKEVFNHLKTTEKCFKTIEKLMMYCVKNNTGFIRNVYKNDELLASGFFVRFNNRIYYLFAASNILGKRHGATTFLIDSVIKQYSNSNFVFDFEGSTIPNVASFYKSFGGDKTIYYNLKTHVFKRFF